jgi:hypothetical protein
MDPRWTGLARTLETRLQEAVPTGERLRMDSRGTGLARTLETR